jgi:hypothetical protein
MIFAYTRFWNMRTQTFFSPILPQPCSKEAKKIWIAWDIFWRKQAKILSIILKARTTSGLKACSLCE